MNDATEIYILKKRIAYLESILSAHNISFDAPDVPSNQSIIVPISAVISPTLPVSSIPYSTGAVTSTPNVR